MSANRTAPSLRTVSVSYESHRLRARRPVATGAGSRHPRQRCPSWPCPKAGGDAGRSRPRSWSYPLGISMLSSRGGSAERERKSLHARTEKLDLELSIGDGLRLPDQLVQTLFGHCAVALLVNVNSVRRAWRLSIDQHAKSHGRSWRRRAHDEMKIAGVKAVRDASIGLVQHGGFLLHRPIAGQRPFIQAQPRGECIDARLVPDRTAGRRKVLGALIADIIFRRLQAAPIGRPLRDRGHRPTPGHHRGRRLRPRPAIVE